MQHIGTRPEDTLWLLFDEQQGAPVAWNFTFNDGRPPVLSLVGHSDDPLARHQAKNVFGDHFRRFTTTDFVARLVRASDSHGIDNLFMFTRERFVPRALDENSISISTILADGRVCEFLEAPYPSDESRFLNYGQHRVSPMNAALGGQATDTLMALLAQSLLSEVEWLESRLRLLAESSRRV